jgi:6-phosphofructokinase 1
LPIAVIGIPKSIDNDLACIDRTFGFETAVSACRTAIVAAHNEAKGAPNGVGLVKLMGRYSGFIAAWATLAHSEVNLVLVPEVPFPLHGPGGVLAYLEDRLRRRHHAVVVVAEGAGQDLLGAAHGTDASGNRRLADIGVFLQDEFKAYLGQVGLEHSIKYIDPSYMIRGIPAHAGDSVYCLQLGQHAAHAGMAGYTGLLVGTWNNHFTHVPIANAVATRKVLDPQSWIWQSVLHATGQPDWGGEAAR